jgi:hypothetical protein
LFGEFGVNKVVVDGEFDEFAVDKFPELLKSEIL